MSTPLSFRTHPRLVQFSLAAVALAGVACTGQILGEDTAPGGSSVPNAGGPGASPNGAPGASPNGAPGADPQMEPTAEECLTGAAFVGPSLMRRLTRAEYNNTVADLLGATNGPANGFTPENRNNGFDNQAASQNVQRDDIMRWESAAKSIAAGALGAADRLLACDVAALGMQACFEQALPNVAARLFRRPLTEDQLGRYREHFAARIAAGATAERAAELSLTAMLMSPSFLYLVESGEDGAQRPLDSFELAARLSYMLWRTAPDETLWQAAQSDLLRLPEELSSQARRLLAHENATRAVQDFYFQWADGPGIDALVVPDGFAETLREDAQAEVVSFIGDWFEATSGVSLVSELFTSRSSRVTEPLARYYGLPEGQSGRVELPAAERSGLLTRAVFVGTHGPPPMRGDFVLNRVLCTPVPPPPVVPPDPTELGEFDTRRELFEAHAALACAKGCHGILDPVGFPFEHYDDTGRYRTEDNGFPVNAATVLSVPGADDVNGPVANAIELSEKLAGSTTMLGCQAEHWFRYAYSRLALPVDKCSVEELSQALQGAQGDVRPMLAELARTDAFRYVRKEAP